MLGHHALPPNPIASMAGYYSFVFLPVIRHFFFYFCLVQHLKDPHSSVRCQCLCLIGHLTQGSESSSMSMEPGSQGGVQNLLASFSEDSDPRVRTSALQALVSEKQIFILFYVLKGCFIFQLDSVMLVNQFIPLNLEKKTC